MAFVSNHHNRDLLCSSNSLRTLYPILMLLGFLLSGNSSASLSAADDLWSVERLIAEKESWSEKVNLPLKIEGRVSAVSKHHFRMVHCDLFFYVSETQSRTLGNVRNVEVFGRLKKDAASGKLVFSVERMKPLPSDLEQFDTKMASLKSDKASDWYELAEWAVSRGKFYNDAELAEKAHRAWTRGIQSEQRALPDGDAEARLALAHRLEKLQLEDSLADELIHEAARLKWQQAKNDSAQRDRFVTWLTSLYPECTHALDTFPQELDEKYQVHPLETFRDANHITRDVLKRLLFIQVETFRITALAKADGSNASAVANQLKEQVPERQDLLEKYLEAAFEWRLKSIATATRQEALQLSEELKKNRSNPTQANELLRQWIDSREQKLRKDGPIGLMQLAEDYLQLVSDEPKAVKLLAEAYRLDPSFTDSSERLKQLGYRLDGNQWVKGEAPETTMPENQDIGRLAIGMTSQEVLTQFGVPTARSRVISGSEIQEVWSFSRRGTSRLLIFLQRPSVKKPAHVTRFLTETSR